MFDFTLRVDGLRIEGMDYSRRSFVKTLFAASQVAMAGRLFAGDQPLVPVDPSGLKFIIVGDWGRKGSESQKQVSAQMALKARTVGAQFVISVGDNFYENGVASVQDPHWEKSFEEVYADPALQVPWKVILGNHDYRGSCEAQLEYARTHPRWGMPARYFKESYAVNATDKADFFYIDTSPWLSAYHTSNEALFRNNVLSQSVPVQRAWLEKALATSIAPWKIVIGHHPIYSSGLHGNEPDLIEQLLPVLQKYKVQAYFCGHDHDLQHLQTDRINLFVSGGGSEHRLNLYDMRALFAQAASGFASVSMNGQQMEVEFIDNMGASLYRATVPQVSLAG